LACQRESSAAAYFSDAGIGENRLAIARTLAEAHFAGSCLR
jgi:hypothetical protein